MVVRAAVRAAVAIGPEGLAAAEVVAGGVAAEGWAG